MLQGIDPVRHGLELIVFLVRKIGDQHRRLAFDQANYRDRATGDRVCNEQFLAVDDVIVAVELCRCPQRGQVRAGAGFGQCKSGNAFSAGKFRQDASLLLSRAKRQQRIHRADAAVNRRRSRDRWIDRCDARQKFCKG